jgi:pimeloyl-ACP methyl ester carboxylesterase
MLDLPNTSQVEGHEIRWGSIGDGPPLIALHGTPFSSQVWRRIIPHTADRRRVYFYDMPGYGQSEMRDGQDVSLGMQNRVLAELLQLWGVEKPDVLAHDFGGATALRLHYLDKIDFASLMIFDAVAMAPWGSPLVQHVRQHEDAFTGMPSYMHRAALDAYLQKAAHSPLTPDALDTYAAPWTTKQGQPAFYRQIAQMDQAYTDEIEPLFGPMPFPVTVLWGSDDDWIPIDKGRQLAKRISSKDLIEIADAGHLVQEDKPEAIVSALVRHLDDVQ